VPRDKCTDLTKWGQEIGDYLSSIKQVNPLRGADLFAAIVDPVLMEIEIARSGRLDEAIDRTIKRLMQVKAAKQVFPNMRKQAKPEPRLISAPENAAAQRALVFERQLKSAKSVNSAKTESVGAEGDVVIEGSCFDEDEPPAVASTPIANELPDSFVASESKPATHTEVVISAKPDVEGTELTDEAVVVPEEPYFNEGELTPVSPTPITHEPPALFATNESTPATPTEVVTSAKPDAEGTEFTVEAVVVPEEPYINEGELIPVSSIASANEPWALFAGNELNLAAFTEAVNPSTPEEEHGEFAAETGLVLEESYIGESGPAPVLSQPIMVEQPAVVVENQLKPASPNETAISAKPEVQTFKTKAGVVLQGAPIEGGVPASVSQAPEKGHFGLLRGIVEVSAEEPPFCLEEMQAISALCNEIHRENAANTGG